MNITKLVATLVVLGVLSAFSHVEAQGMSADAVETASAAAQQAPRRIGRTTGPQFGGGASHASAHSRQSLHSKS